MNVRDLRITAVLDEADVRLTTWQLACKLGEPCEEELGYRLYDWLGAELGIDPNGDAARALVLALRRSGRFVEDADRILDKMADLGLIGGQS